MPAKEEKHFLNDLLLVSLGLFSSGRVELRKAIDKAVKQGKLKQKEGQKVFKTLSKKTEKQRSEIKEVIEEEIGKALTKIGIASPQEVNRLLHQVERLEVREEKAHKAKKKRKKHKTAVSATKPQAKPEPAPVEQNPSGQTQEPAS